MPLEVPVNLFHYCHNAFIVKNSANRPLVKNYYRNAQVGFWYGFIPQLHSTGKNDLLIPEVL